MEKLFLFLISFSFHWHFFAFGATCQKKLLNTLINSSNSMPNAIQLAQSSRLTLLLLQETCHWILAHNLQDCVEDI